MGLFVYTQKGSIISMVDLPTTEIIEPVFFLFIEPLFGIAGIFITSIAGAFYLGKNFQEVRKAKKVIWLAMLAIVTLPIAIPVLLILLGALVALVLLIIGFIMGGFVLGVGLFVSGGYLIWEGFSLLSHGIGVFLLGFGSGLTMLGGAVLVCLVTLIFAYWSWKLVKAFFLWILKRGKRA